MKIPKALSAVAEKADATFAAHQVKLTLGGEPTYVPDEPVGAEWSITALGPTKLRYAYALADTLVARTVKNAVQVYSPGKFYPGEVNPRWAINLVWNRDGSPLVPSLGKPAGKGNALDAKKFGKFKDGLLPRLGLDGGWLRGIDSDDESRPVAVLPLDSKDGKFLREDWQLGEALTLIKAEGPAGLRLPLGALPEGVNRRALAIEIVEGKLHIFLPPLLQEPFLALLEAIAATLLQLRLSAPIYGGYVPSDTSGRWTKLGIASDPGVLEINLPPCPTWQDYAAWLDTLEGAGKVAGLRSFKQISPEEQIGTGGGNHLLFGGPSLEENALFTHPGWVTSMLRYWQHHPALAYLFTGQYVGPSSQAPRPDECVSTLYDLEMAYLFLEQLGPGDHRYLISETLRHIHTDTSGNTHRSEASFDKFWNVNYDGGCRGLIEFRAVESLPHAHWMSAIALLWHTLAAYLLDHPFREPLVDHGDKLHDVYFLPTCLWADFENILGDLRQAGFNLPAKMYREIFEWRFPTMLEHTDGDATLIVRRAHEGWPLLCETPLEGGNTSRFVDTSIERLEFIASESFATSAQIYANGRLLPLQPLPGPQTGVGLRYRRTALYPSLHPGIPPQMPLILAIVHGGKKKVYKLEQQRRFFAPAASKTAPPVAAQPCKKLRSNLVTCDLRIP